MFGINLLRNLPPKVTTGLFYWGMPIFLFFRFLIGTIFGALIVSIALYLLMDFYSDTKPLTVAQLALWLDGLPTESKTAVVTSLLTVAGFLIAFHSATINWKAQAVANLKTGLANEIETFFNEASRLSIDAEIYVQSLIDVMNKINNGDLNENVLFDVQRTQKKAFEFLATRDRLSAMSVEVHRIIGSNYLILSSTWGAIKTLEDCSNAFTEITNKMWVHIPCIDVENPDLISEFTRQVNIKEYVDFIGCCDKNHVYINGLSGGIRGTLLAPLLGINLSAIASLAGKRTLFAEVMKGIKNRKKTSASPEHNSKD